MSWRVIVEGLPTSPKAERAATLAVARAIGRSIADARALLSRLPTTLPRRFEGEAGERLAVAIRELGGKAESHDAQPASSCATHPDLEADFACERCAAAACSLCATRAGPILCEACFGRASRSRAFYLVRVSALLVVLTAVLLYAFRDVSSRHARHTWDHTLRIAIVVLRLDAVDEVATSALAARGAALETRLAAELQRYRSGAPPPFAFEVFGPVDVTTSPPSAKSDGLVDLARHAWEMRSYLGVVDAAAHLTPSAFDARIYLVTRRPKSRARSVVEGEAEQDGRIGTVTVELNRDMVDLALIVATHELFHTLGATDKYDAGGRTLIPDGLAEPDLAPRFPQRFVEVMARDRPVSASDERVPSMLDELAVGPMTAREIGWMH